MSLPDGSEAPAPPSSPAAGRSHGSADSGAGNPALRAYFGKAGHSSSAPWWSLGTESPVCIGDKVS